MWRKIGCLLTVGLTAAACSNTYVLTSDQPQATLGPALPGTAVELNACGACVFGAPDQVFAVPANFAQINFYRLNSLNGGYYHQPGSCDCFVGEVWTYFNSNIQPYPNGNPQAVIVSGPGFDTPSSAGYGQTVPTNQEDCQRYYRASRMWLQLEGSSSWTQLSKQEVSGTWSTLGGGSCNIGSPLSIDLRPSGTN